jgi:hypothetical protein
MLPLPVIAEAIGFGKDAGTLADIIVQGIAATPLSQV